jgi:alpha-beta hydrolase superfamily lysophospholipase
MLRVKTRIRSAFVSFSSEEYILHLYNFRQITALMIENTFTSAPDVLKKHPGIIGYLTFLVTQKWYSARKISHMPTTLPILMLSGLDDTVIPSSHMAKLWEIASTRNSPPKLRNGTVPEYIPPQNDMFQDFPYGQHSEFCLSSSLYIYFLINRTLRYNRLSIWVSGDSFSIFG